MERTSLAAEPKIMGTKTQSGAQPHSVDAAAKNAAVYGTDDLYDF